MHSFVRRYGRMYFKQRKPRKACFNPGCTSFYLRRRKGNFQDKSELSDKFEGEKDCVERDLTGLLEVAGRLRCERKPSK